MTPSLEPATSRRQPLGLELVLAILVSFAVLVPGIQSYSLVDPWETHYGEVTREMLENHDLVHMTWNGGQSPTENEGFRSKPVLTMWLTAVGLTVMGVAKDGGYSGEMVASERTMIGIRLPIICTAVLGLVLMWLMLARLVSRRVAWLALLVVGSTPFFCLISRQGIPDMPHCAFVMGALAMFTLAVEDGDRPVSRAFSLRLGSHRFTIDHGQIALAAIGAWVIGQMLYYVIYFHNSPQLAITRFPSPLVFFPLFMGLLFAGLWRSGFMIVRFVPVIVGALIGIGVALAKRRPVMSGVDRWDDYAPDRFVIRVIAFPIVWATGSGWAETNDVANRLLDMPPIVTMRQVFMVWCYAFLGFSVLAKGPPGLTVVGAVGFLYVLLFWKWRDLYDGKFEITRGLIIMILVFLPWHIAMWLKDGITFINEYLFTHILNRAGGDPDKSLGTFEYYTSQLGHGMWLWAALLPAALAVALLKTRTDTREGRVRFMMVLWAMCGFAVFGIVQTKFHHYILPMVPALGILVAFFLDDVWAKREKFHPLYAALGIAIVLLVCRDLVWQPERWIEMFVFRYDRPWPGGDPWSVDPSDGFLALAAISCAAIALLAIWRRAGVIAIGLAGLAICIWSLQIYMPAAGTHWGMREAMRSYYVNRTIYGEKRVYFGPGELWDDLHAAGTEFHFDTFIPDTLQIGQPMTVTIQLNKASGDDKVMEQQLVLAGTATAIKNHSVTLTLAPHERERLQPLIDASKKRIDTAAKAPPPKDKKTPVDAIYGRPAVRFVDADRLIAWQLYWRGENFWSGDEIFSWAPELRTGFGKPDSAEFLKYMNDRSRAPIGRRYFLVTEAGRATSVKSLLPTQHARESFEVIETTSNKFSMASFIL
jgi:4-amino-4-deoxy-L-arabinose transferase-like glycosyltransferase